MIVSTHTVLLAIKRVGLHIKLYHRVTICADIKDIILMFLKQR